MLGLNPISRVHALPPPLPRAEPMSVVQGVPGVHPLSPHYPQHRPEHTAQLPVERVLEGELIERTNEVAYVYDVSDLRHGAPWRSVARAAANVRTAISTYTTTQAAGNPAAGIGAAVDRFA